MVHLDLTIPTMQSMQLHIRCPPSSCWCHRDSLNFVLFEEDSLPHSRRISSPSSSPLMPCDWSPHHDESQPWKEVPMPCVVVESCWLLGELGWSTQYHQSIPAANKYSNWSIHQRSKCSHTVNHHRCFFSSFVGRISLSMLIRPHAFRR